MKVGIVIVYTVAIFAIWQRYSSIEVFENITLRNIPIIALHVIGLIIGVGIWLIMVYVFSTNYWAKRAINKKISKAERVLGVLGSVRLISYRYSKSGDYVKLRFCADGVSAEIFEEKRMCFQSAINYTILGEIQHNERDWSIIELHARKGRLLTNKEELTDEL